MRQTLGIIVLLLAVPFLRADTVQVLQVTTGFLQRTSATALTYNTVLSGNDFNATGDIVFPETCPLNYSAGQPITACAGGFFFGSLLLTMDGTTQAVDFASGDFAIMFTQDPMFLSGATQATLSEPASISPIKGCIANCSGAPNEDLAEFVIDGNVQFNVSLTQDTQLGGYDVTNEEYTISAAEPGT